MSNRDFGVLLKIPTSGVGMHQPCVGVCVLSDTEGALGTSFEESFPGRRAKGTILEHVLPWPVYPTREWVSHTKDSLKIKRKWLMGFVTLAYLLT